MKAKRSTIKRRRKISVSRKSSTRSTFDFGFSALTMRPSGKTSNL